jgi:hypothetical protein
MPVPSALRKKLITKLSAAFERAMDQVWDEATSATSKDATAWLKHSIDQFSRNAMAHAPESVRENPFASSQPKIDFTSEAMTKALSPQKRGAIGREPKGVVKGAIKDVIYANPQGITRSAIVLEAKTTKNLVIKDGSLRQGLRLLKKGNDIENRNGMWFPTKSGGQSND